MKRHLGMSLALLLLASAGAVRSASAAAVAPKLAALGEQMNLSAPQQQDWQALLDELAKLRDAQRANSRQMLANAESELQKSTADVGKLIAAANQSADSAGASRASAEADFLHFYAQATAAQQQQMREFALKQLKRLDSLRELRAAFVSEN